MAYITQLDLRAKLPPQLFKDACDDGRDGTSVDEVVSAILADASSAVDQYLEQRYVVPLNPRDFAKQTLPAIVTRGALMFALASVYGRRGVELPKDLADDLKSVKETLGQIRDGELPLVSGITAGGRVGAAITECSSINGGLS